MAEKIEAKETDIGSLFSPSFLFEIPIYQRPLSWARENFEQLFDDIYESSGEADNQYFLGSIILQEKNKNVFEVVDGQQRLTALAVLLAVIRDLTSNSELKTSLKLSLFQEEDKYKEIPRKVRITPWDNLKDIFDKYVYREVGTTDFKRAIESKEIKYVDQDDAIYHLFESISCFSERYSRVLQNQVRLDSFVKYLMKNVYMVYIKTAGFGAAFRMFTVLNTRGVSLSIADLLKSENLGEIKNDMERTAAARKWHKIEEELGRDNLEKIVIFIRTIHLREKSRFSIYDEYQSQIFGKGILNRGKQFINYVSDIADIYEEKVLDPDLEVEAEKRNRYRALSGLLRHFLPFDDWIPPILAFHQKFKSDDALCNFTMELEKKVIVEWAVGFSLTERIGSLNKVVKLISEKEKWEDVIPLIKGWELPQKLRDDFSGVLSDSQFYIKYGGRLARYVLLRLDLELWEMENFGGYSGSVTIEHILPQSPKGDSTWVKLFDEEQRLNLTNCIGNLVLLSGRKNSEAQNFDFDKKTEAYFKKKSTPFRLTGELERIKEWTPKELLERQELLIKNALSIYF